MKTYCGMGLNKNLLLSGLRQKRSKNTSLFFRAFGLLQWFALPLRE